MKRKKGFTIVEILVVLAILGVLMAIAVPGIMNISNKMKERGLNSKLDSIKEGARVYAQNNSNQIKDKILKANAPGGKCNRDSKDSKGNYWCKCDPNSISSGTTGKPDCKFIYTMTVDELIAVGAYKTEQTGTSTTVCDVTDPTSGSRCLDCLKVSIHIDDEYKSADAYIDENEIKNLTNKGTCS